MKQYLELIQDILDNGECISPEAERTGAGAKSVFGRMIRFDISEGRLPMVTTRKVSFSQIFHEMMFFLNGETNVESLREKGVNFWDDWATTKRSFGKLHEKLHSLGYHPPDLSVEFIVASAFNNPEGGPEIGSIGPMYGFLWRHWPADSVSVCKLEIDNLKLEDIPSKMLNNIKKHFGELELPEEKKEELYKQSYLSSIDQIGRLVKNLKEDPYSRRHVVTAFHPAYGSIPGIAPNQQAFLGRGALFPCHIMFQVNVRPPKTDGGKKRLSLKLSMRSWDICLGGPYNIAGYAFLAHVLAREVGMDTDELIIEVGDCHVYMNQIEKAKEQLQREPREVPRIVFKHPAEVKSMYDLEYGDIEVRGYEPHPAINYARNV